MATTIATLNTIVTGTAVQLINELNKASKATYAFGRGIKTVMGALGVGFSVAGVIGYGKSILDLGGQIVDLSRVAGLSTDAFQTLAAAGMGSGFSMQDVAKASENMRRSIQDAAEGSKPMIDNFAKLNLTAEGLQALAPEKQWEIIAQRVAAATDKQAALNAVSDIYGAKLGPKMREVLEIIAGGFDKAGSATAALTFTPEQLDSIDKAGDKLAELWMMAKVGGAKAVLGIGDLIDEGTEKAKAEMARNQMDAMATGGGAGKVGWWEQRALNFKAKFGGDGPSISSMEDPMHGRGFMPPTADGKGTAGNPIVVQLDAESEAQMRAAQEAKKQEGDISGLLNLFFGSMDKSSATDQARFNAAFGTTAKDGAQFQAPQADKLQRLGMLTGEKKDEPQKQTGILKGIHQVLIQMHRENITGRNPTSVFGD